MGYAESLTKDRMLAIEAASVVGGTINGSGHLILTKHDGSTIDAGSALPALPVASDTVQGIVELATNAEATAGTDTVRAVTPAGLAAAVGTLVPDASDTVKGKVELATTAEATAGTDTVRAVTPAGLAAYAPQATTTTQGKVELATNAEATTGTDTDRAVTPAGVNAAITAALAAWMNTVYPVGSIYMSTASTNPATLFGVGSWTAISGQFLIGQNGSTYVAGTPGGASTATLTTTELPAHTHGTGTLVTASGGGHTHSIGRDKTGATGSVEYINHSTGTSGAGQIYSGQLTTDGAHTHTISGSTASAGTGSAFSIMPPYLPVYMWKRTA